MDTKYEALAKKANEYMSNALCTKPGCVAEKAMLHVENDGLRMEQDRLREENKQWEAEVCHLNSVVCDRGYELTNLSQENSLLKEDNKEMSRLVNKYQQRITNLEVSVAEATNKWLDAERTTKEAQAKLNEPCQCQEMLEKVSRLEDEKRGAIQRMHIAERFLRESNQNNTEKDKIIEDDAEVIDDLLDEIDALEEEKAAILQELYKALIGHPMVVTWTSK